jgi:tRNA(fMet)-specific endonuclease VapC
MQYLLDTSICIFFLRGKMNLDEIFREKGVDNIYISEITVFELIFGAENSENVKKSHEAVERFIKRLSIIPIIGSVHKYAEIKVILRKNGKPINDEFDLIIGVTALDNRLTLVTDNEKNFKDIDGLKMENWYKRS